MANYFKFIFKLFKIAQILMAINHLFFSAHPLALVSGSGGAGNRRAGKPALSVRAP